METIRKLTIHVGKHTVRPMDSIMAGCFFPWPFPGRKRSDSTRRRCRTTKTWGKTEKGWKFWIFVWYPRPKDWVVVSNIFKGSTLFGEDVHFDWYFSDGLKPPTRGSFLFFNEDVWNQQLRSKKDSKASESPFWIALYLKNDKESNWTLVTLSPIIMVPLRISDWTHPKRSGFGSVFRRGLGCISSLH